jgi:hypothetical protein
MGLIMCYVCGSPVLGTVAVHDGTGNRHVACPKDSKSDVTSDLPPKPDIGDLIEKLVTATVRLYMLCDRKAELAKPKTSMTLQESASRVEEMRKLMADDIELCKTRAQLRGEINRALGGAGDSVKLYGRAT